MNEGSSLISGLSAVASFTLIATGFWLLRQPGGNRTKAGLMIVAGLVILFNVWIMTLPVTGGV